MDNILENLTNVLAYLDKLHQKLLELAEEKRNAVIKGDLPGLEQIVRDENEVLAQVEKAEDIRCKLAQAARDEFHIEEDPLKMGTLADVLGEAGSPLRKITDHLKQTIEKLRFRNRQNSELLKASITHVNDFMDMLSRATTNHTYNRKGQSKGGLRLFDRTA